MSIPERYLVDQKARDDARDAMSAVSSHERVCAERAREAATWRRSTTDKLDDLEESLTDKITALAKSVSGVYNRMWTTMCSVVGLLVMMVGYLIINKGL